MRRQCNMIRGSKWKHSPDPSGLRPKREAIDRPEGVHGQEVTQKQHANTEASVPVGGGEEKNLVGVERFPLHQEGHVRHVLVVQEVRI